MCGRGVACRRGGAAALMGTRNRELPRASRRTNRALYAATMQAVIIAVGDELTTGQTVDTNSAWLARQLAEIGVGTLQHVTVADQLEAVRDEIARAAARCDVVLVSGGLGPTADDLTREALAAALGAPLERNEQSEARLREFFARRRREMPAANLVQAMCPRGAAPIDNTCGTAPGIHARLGAAEVYAVPGVPREMKVMFERDIRPALQARAGGAAIVSTVLYTYGAAEADIGEQLRDLMRRDRNPAVGTTAQETVIGVRIVARGDSPPAARDLLAADAAEVRGRLGAIVYGENDPRIAAAVGELLRRAGRTIATAESCTGGLIAKQLTDIPGSSAYLLEGIVTYSNAAKTRRLGVPEELIRAYGAVSAAVAEAMAVGCRVASGADYALSVTGIAGPDGGTADKPIGLVYVGLADAGGCEVKEYRLGEYLTRDEVRDRTAKAALNRVRLKLL